MYIISIKHNLCLTQLYEEHDRGHTTVHINNNNSNTSNTSNDNNDNNDNNNNNNNNNNAEKGEGT